MDEARTRILFLCTGNSCRSQMAEGFARALRGDRIEPHSAGTAPHELNLDAVKVMAEAGVDISAHYPKTIQDLGDLTFDYVVTVCDNANESCPIFPGQTTVVHVGFEDPPKLAAHALSEDDGMSHYRRIRDEIKAFIETLPESLESGGIYRAG